jgi:peroxiredoxin
MVATFWLLGCVLVPAQAMPKTPPRSAPPAYSGDWVLTPRLARGQEVVYRGSFSEQATGMRVQFQRAYRFETRFFVLDTPPRSVRLAAFTTMQDRTATRPMGVRTEPISSSVRLERIELDLQGKILADSAAPLKVPLDGPPTLEVGAFVEAPRGRIVANQGWEAAEAGRPPVVWRVEGPEKVNGQVCVKLAGVQQPDSWDRPRADCGSWRRHETVWLSPRTGLAVRVERTIEQREPASRDVTRKSALRYELESNMPLPAQLAQDRRQEILQALALRDSATPLLAAPSRYTRELETVQRKIAYHLENQPTTPYREALLLLKRQVEAGRRGEVLPVVHEESTRPTVAALGEPAPDFIATECTGTGSARLARWKGKAVLLVFYSPTSYTAGDLLRFAQDVQNTYGKHVAVVGMSVSDDTTAVLKQRTALGLGFPILHGGGVRISYAVETTPKMVLIDSVGMVRGTYVGWGHETPTEVLTELRRWLPSR